MKYACRIIQNPETKANIKFLVEFGKYYWTPGYSCLWRNDLTTSLDAHSAHEFLVQVFNIQNKIKSLINDGCQTNAIFKDFYTNLMRLSYDESHIDKVTMSSRKSTAN